MKCIQRPNVNLIATPFFVLAGVSVAGYTLDARADLFCYPGEKNCKVDGRIGTSGNDIFGNSGGDTIQKGAGMLDRIMGTGGSIQRGVNNIYEPNKRGILDCVGASIAPSLPGVAGQSIDTSRCGSAGRVNSMPYGQPQQLPPARGSVQMGGWQSPGNPNGGTVQYMAPQYGYSGQMQGMPMPRMQMPGMPMPSMQMPGMPMPGMQMPGMSGY